MVICNDGGERTENKWEEINDYRFYIKAASGKNARGSADQCLWLRLPSD